MILIKIKIYVVVFFHVYYQIANSLDPHQDRHFATPARCKNCLQMVSADYTSEQSVKINNKDNMIKLRPGVIFNYVIIVIEILFKETSVTIKRQVGLTRECHNHIPS